jgi:Xaa-Pro aminopeptidase
MLDEKYLIPIEKTEQLTELLADKKIDALLVYTREGSDPTLPFLTGDDAIHLAAAFFRPDGNHIMLTSVSDKKKYEVSGIFSEVITYEQDTQVAFKELFDKLDIKTLALNISENETLCDGLTQGLYLQLESVLGKDFLENQTVSSEEILITLRSKKSDTEIAHLREAIKITQQIYSEVFTRIRCGMSEIEIAELFVEGLKRHDVVNGIGGGYEYPIVCLVRAGLAHRNPGHEKSRPGDILIVDFSVRYKGYVSDIARTAYFLNKNETKPPESIQHAFQTAYDAITNSINALRPGKKGHEIDEVGRKTIEAGGYPTVRHSVGHQIGIACHEVGTRLSPPTRPHSDGVIASREVYAIEPTVIQDEGLPCMLVEENVLVKDEDSEILSVRQDELVLIPYTAGEANGE